ncbi:MAG: YdcF family protein [Rhizobiaceae bacterium]|nr:YdcF family protein [Rhizobiaceae bacterium]
MFFYLSKIFWFFIQPINLSIFLLIAAVLAGLVNRRRIVILACAAGTLILVAATWTSLGALMLGPLEDRYSRPPLPDRVDGVIVLGGGLEGQINLARGGYELNSSGDRFVEAAVLARRFPDAKIVISGGTGSMIVEAEADADTAVRFFGALGIPRDRLLLENRSRNTFENAVFTKDLVQPKTGETWLLVTSAFHMPRSVGLFEKAGFEVLPWPVDYRTTGNEGLGLFQDNAVDSLQATTLGLREWIGLVAYWLSGRLDSPFPGPR